MHGQTRVLDSMHACLNVDEIVRLIACELVASGGERTAAALARCCRSFEDPVLDTLWETQDDLLPLLESFPRDVWNEGGCTSFKRLPTTAEWGRFRKYARRMRELGEWDVLGCLSLEVFLVLQLCTTNEHLLPNLKTLKLWEVREPFIPLFLSPRITSILLHFESDLPKAVVASTVSSLPRLCPELQTIRLYYPSGDPMITAAVSGMVLATNRNTLQQFHTDIPLTTEASEMIFKLSSLRSLSVVTKGEASLPSASLPNLTKLEITCDNEGDWPRLFHRATFGKLESLIFSPKSEEIGDFLGAFERVTLSSSVRNTLSKFYLSTSCSWYPNYSSLLPFTQLVELSIGFSCEDGCSSMVDDNIIINLSRAMPKLAALRLGDDPCEESTMGVTAKGLMTLALHCPELRYLRVHLQVASLSAPPASPGTGHNTESSGSWAGCALTTLEVGEIQVGEESVLMVALTLLRIFPRIMSISFVDKGWRKVDEAIRISKRIADFSKADG